MFGRASASSSRRGSSSEDAYQALLAAKEASLESQGDSPYSRSSSSSSSSSSPSRARAGPGQACASLLASPRWGVLHIHARRHRLAVVLLAASALVLAVVGYVRAATMRKHYFDIHLRPEVDRYLGSLHRQEQYTWSADAFLPPDGLLAWTFSPLRALLPGASARRPLERTHTVATFPQRVELDGLPHPVAADEIVFGFVTPYRRAREMSEHWASFLGHGSHCLVVLPPEEQPLVEELTYFLRHARGFTNCKVTSVDLGKYPRYEHRVLDLPRRMFLQDWTDSSGKPVQPKYYVVGDDDTVWFDIRSLQREMSLRDYSQHHMLCGVTESKQQVGRHGRICFGGAGIVLSQQLVSKMNTSMNECLWWHSWRFGGDEMLSHCASTASGIEPDKVFEELDGMHQCDIPGDMSGFIQSGLPFLSIHHWLGWIDMFPWWSDSGRAGNLNRLKDAAAFLGADNLFKRFVFDDGRTLLTLGYSVTLFSAPLVPEELSQIEQTHRYWEHNMRWPERPVVPEGRRGNVGKRYKVTYYLRETLPHEGVMVYEDASHNKIRLHIDDFKLSSPPALGGPSR